MEYRASQFTVGPLAASYREETCPEERSPRSDRGKLSIPSVTHSRHVELRNEANSVPDLDFIRRSRRRPIGPMLDARCGANDAGLRTRGHKADTAALAAKWSRSQIRRGSGWAKSLLPMLRAQVPGVGSRRADCVTPAHFAQFQQPCIVRRGQSFRARGIAKVEVPTGILPKASKLCCSKPKPICW